MKQPSGPSRAEIEAATWFLPFFERAAGAFGRWEEDLDGTVRVKYSEDVQEFVRLLEERGWVESGYRPGAAALALRHWQFPGLVATADLRTVHELLGDILRTERICPGHLLQAFERGYLVAVLRRLRELGAAAPRD